jgi:hypothetical protein
MTKKEFLDVFPSTPTAYSVRKTRIAKIIEKYQNPGNHLDEFFQNIFFLSTTKQTNSTSMVTVQS